MRTFLCKEFILPVLLMVGILALGIYGLTRSENDNFVSERVQDTLKKVEYEGHTYLVYYSGYKFGICHDENCKCKRFK